MFRKWCLVAALLSGSAMVGCGLINSEIAKTQALRPGAVTRTFDVPAARVMMTTLELNWGEITWNESFDFNLKSTPVGKAGSLKPGSGAIALNPEELSLEPSSITGKTKDGRAVNVWLRPIDQDKKTEVTVLIGKLGDPALSNTLLDKIADRLAHPPVRTPEEIEKRKIRVPVVNDAGKLDAKPANQP
jgi:hypothetical protein